MLRIHINKEPGTTTLYLEGRLAGDCVEELRRVWTSLRESSANNTQTIVDLCSVRTVDSTGRALLSEMHGCGTRLAGSGLCIGPLIEEIINGVHNASIR